MAKSSRKVALGGVLGALCIICLYIASYLPTGRLFFYGVSSVFCAVILMEAGTKWAWAFYFSTMSLSLILIPDKIRVMPYATFFGIYGIIKYYIEGIRNLPAAYILKGIFFILVAFIIMVAARELFTVNISSGIPEFVLAIGGLGIFYIYDYAYSRFIAYYENNISKKTGK